MLTDEEKAYIHEIVREANQETLNDHEKRIVCIEKKVFNGFGTSIAWLKWLIGVLYVGFTGFIFWLARGNL